MATTISTSKVKDYCCKCRDCGAPLKRPETIITYWDSVSTDGRKRISTKGISEIAVNAGICDDCQVKNLRKELEWRQKDAENKGTSAPGSGAVALCWIGLFVSLLALGLKATRVNEFGQPMPFVTTWFYIWVGLGLICLIGLPIAYSYRNRASAVFVLTVSEELKNMDDSELFTKYSMEHGVPYMKWCWSKYVVTTGGGGLVYASEVSKMGSVEAVSKALHVRKEMADDLLNIARHYS